MGDSGNSRKKPVHTVHKFSAHENLIFLEKSSVEVDYWRTFALKENDNKPHTCIRTHKKNLEERCWLSSTKLTHPHKNFKFGDDLFLFLGRDVKWYDLGRKKTSWQPRLHWVCICCCIAFDDPTPSQVFYCLQVGAGGGGCTWLRLCRGRPNPTLSTPWQTPSCDKNTDTHVLEVTRLITTAWTYYRCKNRLILKDAPVEKKRSETQKQSSPSQPWLLNLVCGKLCKNKHQHAFEVPMLKRMSTANEKTLQKTHSWKISELCTCEQCQRFQNRVRPPFVNHRAEYFHKSLFLQCSPILSCCSLNLIPWVNQHLRHLQFGFEPWDPVSSFPEVGLQWNISNSLFCELFVQRCIHKQD